MKEIIGITGPIASGKDIAAGYISKKLRVQQFQLSQAIIEIAKEKNIPLIRKDLIRLTLDITKEKGGSFLAEKIFERIKNKGIITGIRQLNQINFLKSNSDFKLISINAKPEIRFERAKQRNKIAEATTLRQFIDDEIEENSHDIQNLFKCMKIADYHISNNASLEEFYGKIDIILNKIKE